ncbi:MAG TPA: hypothetical protein VFV86_02355 [Nitrososphaeraceae archaeon]|nr:hypothetical protein [Nitrososphaeraceae archaeon]
MKIVSRIPLKVIENEYRKLHENGGWPVDTDKIYDKYKCTLYSLSSWYNNRKSKYFNPLIISLYNDLLEFNKHYLR